MNLSANVKLPGRLDAIRENKENASSVFDLSRRHFFFFVFFSLPLVVSIFSYLNKKFPPQLAASECNQTRPFFLFPKWLTLLPAPACVLLNHLQSAGPAFFHQNVCHHFIVLLSFGQTPRLIRVQMRLP